MQSFGEVVDHGLTRDVNCDSKKILVAFQMAVVHIPTFLEKCDLQLPGGCCVAFGGPRILRVPFGAGIWTSFSDRIAWCGQ